MSVGPVLAMPGEENDYQDVFIRRVVASYARVTGRQELNDQAGRSAWFGDFALLTHRGDPRAMLNYGNKCALDLWECDWQQFTATPSSATAPDDDRASREAMMQQVLRDGFVSGYEGRRVSRTGRLFLIQDVTIWRLLEENGDSFGVAAYFSRYRYL